MATKSSKKSSPRKTREFEQPEQMYKRFTRLLGNPHESYASAGMKAGFTPRETDLCFLAFEHGMKRGAR